MKSERIKYVKKGKAANGKKAYLEYLKGKTISPEDAIKAKCYDCMNCYWDGLLDCNTPSCPLYHYHPYNTKEKINREASLTLKERMEKAVKLIKK